MKIYQPILIKFIIALICLVSVPTFSQLESQVKSDEKFHYKVNGYILFNQYSIENKKIEFKTLRAGPYLYDVIGESKYVNNSKNQDFFYYLIQITPFKRDIEIEKDSIKMFYTHREKKILKKEKEHLNLNTKTKPPTKLNTTMEFYRIRNKKELIDIGDQENLYWMRKDIFDNNLTNGYIKKKYYTWWKSLQFAYGAALSIPFKIRPETDGKNMKITPEISLGGYIGPKFRINKYKEIYLYPVVVTAGITTIGISKDNTIKEVETKDIKDGLVFARTASLGSFMEFNAFQIGVVMGWDKPGGEIGKDWIYNDRLWYSFSIGYNFLGKNKDN